MLDHVVISLDSGRISPDRRHNFKASSFPVVYHQGLSNGSDPPPNPPNPPAFGFGGCCAAGLVADVHAPNPPAFDLGGCCVTGLAADVHPPKSSSAVTDACLAGLFADAIGAPQPPDMSFGVIFSGGLPRFTAGAADFAGAASGTPQGLLSPPEAHGSNMLLLF
jgi:hypothetical protein